MERISISRLAEEVAQILGEALMLECHPDESPFPSIESRVRCLAPGVLSGLVIDAPRYFLPDAVRWKGEAKADSDGTVRIKLPDNFLRLVEVRMSDWKFGVTEVCQPGTRLYFRQGSSWKGVRGSSERPVAIRGIEAEGGESLLLYSSAPDAVLDYLVYVPEPEVTEDDMMEVPRRLLFPLVEKLALILRTGEYATGK